jgi:hypothetical protein
MTFASDEHRLKMNDWRDLTDHEEEGAMTTASRDATMAVDYDVPSRRTATYGKPYLSRRRSP